MSKALTFTRLDLLTVKPYLTVKTMSITVIMCALMAFNPNSSMFLGMSLIFMSVYYSYPFAIAEKNSMDLMYCSLPITRKDVVKGRFIFLALANLLAGSVIAVISVFLTILRGSVSAQELFVVFVSFFTMINIMSCIQFCIYFRFPFSKSRLLAYLPMVIISSVGLAFAQLSTGQNRYFETGNSFETAAALWPAISAVCLALLAACYLVTFSISVKLYEKKEF